MYVFQTLRALNLQITGRKCTLQCTTKTQTAIAYRKRTPKHEANSQALTLKLQLYNGTLSKRKYKDYKRFDNYTLVCHFGSCQRQRTKERSIRVH